MWEELKEHNKKKAVWSILGFVLAIAMLAIIFFNLFGFVDLLADDSVSANQIRLFGGLLFVFFGVAMLISARRAGTKSYMDSIEKYAEKTENPEATMAQLKAAWETGADLGQTRMNDHYIIMLSAFPFVKVIPLKNAIWAYKTISRMNFIKTGAILTVCFDGQKAQVISIPEKRIDACLQQFLENHHDVVVGSTREVQKLYGKNDIAGMKEYARQQRIGLIV